MEKQRKLELKGVAVMSLGLLVIAYLKSIFLLYVIASALMFLSLCFELVGKWIYFAWMKLAYLLSLIMPKIMLSLLFFLVLFPLSFISKLFRKNDPLMLKNSSDSFFINSNKRFVKKDFEKPW